jgi:hypothetical protein
MSNRTFSYTDRHGVDQRQLVRCGVCNPWPTTRWSCTATGISTGSASGGLLIVSARSPVMEATDDRDTYSYVRWQA